MLFHLLYREMWSNFPLSKESSCLFNFSCLFSKIILRIRTFFSQNFSHLYGVIKFQLKLIKKLSPNPKPDLLLFPPLDSHLALGNYLIGCSFKIFSATLDSLSAHEKCNHRTGCLFCKFQTSRIVTLN